MVPKLEVKLVLNMSWVVLNIYIFLKLTTYFAEFSALSLYYLDYFEHRYYRSFLVLKTLFILQL